MIAGAFTVGLLIPKVLDAIGTKGVLNQPRSDKADDQSAATRAEVPKAAARK